MAVRYAGWVDGVARVACARLIPRPPAAFPVAAHPGAATLPTRQVAARPGALLLCDGSHPGPHLWAEGEPVGDDELGAPAAVALRPPPPAPSREGGSDADTGSIPDPVGNLAD